MFTLWCFVIPFAHGMNEREGIESIEEQLPAIDRVQRIIDICGVDKGPLYAWARLGRVAANPE